MAKRIKRKTKIGWIVLIVIILVLIGVIIAKKRREAEALPILPPPDVVGPFITHLHPPVIREDLLTKVDIFGMNFKDGATVNLWNPDGKLIDVEKYFISPLRIWFRNVFLQPGVWKIQVVNPDGRKSLIYSFKVRPKIISLPLPVP